MKAYATKNKRRKHSRKTIKHKRQHGASNTPSIAPYAISSKNGGSFSVPAPLVGAPWTSSPNSWSGYGTGNENHGNHFPQNMYNQDTKMMIKYTGGRKTRRKKKRQKKNKKHKIKNTTSKHRQKRNSKRSGGASFIQNVANSYRDIAYNFDSGYNALRGYNSPVNPAPYKDQLQAR